MGYPEYSSKKSKRMYSDHAKIGLLALMEYLDKSFAEFTRILPSLESVIRISGITDIPEESTLRKFRRRLDPEILDKVIAYQSSMVIGNSETTIGIDATGFPSTHASRYYVMRLKQMGTENSVVRGFTKATFATCVHTKVLLAVDADDSRTADIKRLEPVVDKLAASGQVIKYVLADKGYDAEYAHIMIRERLDAEAIIPVRDAPKKESVYRTTGVNRSRMKREMKEGTETSERYRMRPISETANSMVKCVLGEILNGRDPKARHSELMFKCVAHNFRIGMKYRNSGMFV